MSELASVDLEVWASRVSEQASGSLVVNVYRMEDGSYLIRLRKGDQFTIRLVPRFCAFLVQGVYERRGELDEFAKLARREINKLQLLSIEPVEGERILTFSFGARGSVSRLLISELFPGGCTAITTHDHTIIGIEGVSKTTGMRSQVGSRYQPPERRVSVTSADEVLSTLTSRSGRERIGQVVARDLGLGRKYSNEVLYRCGIAPLTKITELSDESMKRIAESVESLVKEVRSSTAGWLYVSQEELSPSPIRLYHFEGKGVEPIALPSLNDAIKAYYEEHLNRRAAASLEEEVSRRKKSLEEEISKKRAASSSLLTEAESVRNVASLMMRYLGSLEALRKRIPEGYSGMGLRVVEESSDRIIVEIEGNRLVVMTNVPVSQQASVLFERAKNLTRGARNIEEEIRGLEVEIEKLSRKRPIRVEEPIRTSQRPRREWYTAYRWCFTSGGKLVVAGRDSSSNVRLLKRHLEDDDLVFHAELRGSPVAVLKKGSEASEAEIREAACFCASYSRAWRELLTSVSVYWVRPDQIDFTPPPGTYLPKGSFIIKPPKQYVTSELGISIGLTYVDGGREPIAGPHGWVSSVSRVHMKVVPGEKRSIEIARTLNELLAEINEPPLTDEELVRTSSLIPFGKGRVVKG
ncbi:MAG: NFACT family protein [Aigarchaeota archaeon]|nr:NFACT family protein [Aigarchaeota archaeon]MDW8093125.1 NFACT family protein [Nitrososphaerota archaeon]